MAEGGGLFANVAEAGDIALFAMLFAATLVVGLTLLGIDAVVRRLGERVRKRTGR
jgi:hypothetical protein